MNRLLKYIFSCLVLITFIGCSDAIDNSSSIFELTERINSSAFSSELFTVRYPFRIRQEMDGDFLLMDLHGTEDFCCRINSTNLSEKGFAHRGVGPNDLQGAENIRIDMQGNVYVLDANKMMIKMYDHDLLEPIKEIGLDKQLIRTLDFDIVNDSTFVVPDYSGEYRYHLVNTKGKIIQSCFSIPVRKRNQTTHNIVYAQAWRSFVDYNANNDILAMVTQLGQVLEIYSLKENKIINTVYGEQGEPEFIDNGAYAVPNGIMGYSDVYVGTDKIYALFWGRTFKDIRNKPDIIEGGNQLEVYDLNGNPLCKYILDKYITGFTIDEKHNQMIAIDINSNQPLIKYALHKIVVQKQIYTESKIAPNP